MGEPDPLDLEIFHGAVEVMLQDGILTREEKRLVIKLANLLGIGGDDPKRIYQAVVEGKNTVGGRKLDHSEMLNTYEKLFEVALVNENISQDEYNVLAYLRKSFKITEFREMALRKP